MEPRRFRFAHENLDAWQRAMDLVVESYQIAKRLPGFEMNGLCSQIRRAAVSIPANIAEGCGRVGVRDRLRFLAFARASTCELQTLFAAVERLEYVKPADLVKASSLLNQVGQLTSGLRRRLLSMARASTRD